MGLIKWKKEYSLNNEIIDNQHQKLIKLINDLHEAMEYRSDSSILDTIMKELSDYTFYHFSFEEEYLIKNEYPDIEEHRRLHEGLVKDVHDTFVRIAEGNKDMVQDIYLFLSQWLINHILKEDYKYYEYINETK